MIGDEFYYPHCRMKIYGKECPIGLDELPKNSVHSRHKDCPLLKSGAAEALESVDALEKLLKGM